ncbi:MAG: hypothetical protein CVV57_09300 [Tenericutes bacterium HGW-Tenericutes-2]|jgi:UDP-3-O-[3-hydroxymyristoyl] glucosamine N-acyltransferase|nr:MAG: hypothetical protein CVV57_09300 [Tenericutes bacterium HGW-Tenericutes-2]
MNTNDIEKLLIKESVNYVLIGNKDVEFIGFSSLKNYKSDTITWARNDNSFENIEKKSYQLLIGCKDLNIESLTYKTVILVDDPKKVFFHILEVFFKSEYDLHGISNNARISDLGNLGVNVTVGDYSYIGPNVKIGRNTVIGNNVTILGNVTIGEFTKIQSGTIIGEDGFAYLKDENGNLQHAPHFGGVRIGNHVSIGANVCIARGAIDDTIIDDYVKIDNLVHIAHNCNIGSNTIIIPGTYIYGSVTIGKNCWISTSCIRDQITIGDNVTVGMGAVVTKSVANGVTVIGNPARPFERGK